MREGISPSQCCQGPGAYQLLTHKSKVPVTAASIGWDAGLCKDHETARQTRRLTISDLSPIGLNSGLAGRKMRASDFDDLGLGMKYPIQENLETTYRHRLTLENDQDH